MHVIDLIVNIHPFVLLYSCAVLRGIYGLFLFAKLLMIFIGYRFIKISIVLCKIHIK